MNAKQAEEKSGISRRNLRFYEQQGLIHPSRNPDNDYRDYSAQDIECLKTIRALRMLDVTLEDIHSVLNKDKKLETVMAQQEAKLKKRQRDLETAIRFCQELQTSEPDLDDLLNRMDQPEVSNALFGGWVRDYQAIARAEAQKHFNFVPDEAVTTPQEFTMALFAYGQENDKDVVITREGMEPEFTVDGIEYTAQRVYRPLYPGTVAVILCDAVHPEDFETEVEKNRSKFMRFVYRWWWLLPVIVLELTIGIRAGMGSIWLVVLAALPPICGWTMDAVLYRARTK